ncbi:MAG: hypothetical protein HYS13_11835, partial [Planctomycetia bacterium]|nr:hypothetical protein [Planctomycetia bacterium]
MNAQQFQQRLVGEVRRSPVKAALLAVLLLAAAWFWGPLVLKLFTKSEDAIAADAASLVAPAGASASGHGTEATPVAGQPAPSAVRAETKRPSWRTVVKMVAEQKSSRTGLTRLLSGRNPFARWEETKIETQSPTSVPADTHAGSRPPVDVTASLKLAAVSIGKERRVAIINGR